MPYKNIVFVKLEKRLLNDHRWFSMSDKAQLLYIKLLLGCAETYNKLPSDRLLLRRLLRIEWKKSVFDSAINEIENNFPKFQKVDNYYEFGEFETKTNYIRECPSSAKVVPKVVTDIDKEKDKEEDKEKIEGVFNSWNEFAGIRGLSKILKLTDTRKNKIKKRLAEKDFNFDFVLQRIDESDFLLGKGSKWKVSFDFIFENNDNWIKILEGKYGNNGKVELRETINRDPFRSIR